MLSNDNKSMSPIVSELLRSKQDSFSSSIKLFNTNLNTNLNTENTKLSPIKPVKFFLKDYQQEYRECREYNCKKEIQKLKERVKILTELIISSNKEIEELKNKKDKDNKENNIIISEPSEKNKEEIEKTLEKSSYLSYLPYVSVFSLSALFYFINKRRN